MIKVGVNEYQCSPTELIEIKFYCNPSRENVNIRGSFDGVHFVTVTTNSIQFVMGTEDIVLDLQYAFILAGSCLNQVVVVDNSPTNDDRVIANASGGGTDFQNFLFKA